MPREMTNLEALNFCYDLVSDLPDNHPKKQDVLARLNNMRNRDVFVHWSKELIIQCLKDFKKEKYYCVAMGSFYSKKLGDTFKITTENGSFYIIICDFKDDDDTDSSNRYTKENGCITEFYVDNKKLSPKVKRMGSVSYASDKFKGKIKKIEKLENYFSIKQ